MIGQLFDYTEIEGIRFSLIPIVPFEAWVERNYKGMDKFNTLSMQDREKVFLRWKWGFQDERSNAELEASEKATLFLFKDSDLSAMNDAWKFHIQQKRVFDRVCYDVKKRIGLTTSKNEIVDKLKKQFSAGEV